MLADIIITKRCVCNATLSARNACGVFERV
jgi:hypothetical protein